MTSCCAAREPRQLVQTILVQPNTAALEKKKMTSILRVVAIALFALAGSWEVRANDPSACYMLNSNDWNNSEKYDAAILACDRLISYTKGHVQAAAYRTRGYWKHKKGNSQSALEDFDTGIRLDP